MKKLQVFDPAMCCSSGVCGTNVDTKLVTFANDLEWLKKQGIEVERYGLSFDPSAFVKNENVKKTLEKEGNDCLPLIVVDNQIVYKCEYPDRKKLAKILNLEFKAENIDKEAVASNSICGPECDCHQSAVSDKTKKIIFAVVLLIIVGIIAFKACYKANAIEAKHNILASNKAVSPQLGGYIDSMRRIKSNQDVSFIYIPAKNNVKISEATKNAAISAKKKLNAKNITVDLYTLKTTSSDYPSIASQSNPPEILVVSKGKGSFVSGKINETRILQAYIIASRPPCSGPCKTPCK